MLLAVDIGNTNISFAIFKGDKIIRKFNIPTKNYSAKLLKNKLGKTGLVRCVICSVVPKVTGALAKDLKRLLGVPSYIIGKDIKVPIKNLYRRPYQVGWDRLVNAYAGVRFYGSPLILIDFGTAVTFDVVSKKREYLGGMILPGLQISLDALNERTALLPRVRLNKPREFIGRDTESSMLSGIIYGFAAISDELSERIRLKIGSRARVIGTGGNINLIKPYCVRIDKADADLTLKGLNLIYKKNKKNS